MASKKQSKKTKNGKKQSGKKNDKKKGEDKPGVFDAVKRETLQTVVAITLFVVAAFLILSAFGKAGIAGEYVYSGLEMLFGYGYILLPVLFVVLGVAMIRTLEESVAMTQTAGAALFFVAGLGLLDVIFKEEDSVGAGGMIGGAISSPLVSLFEIYVTITILVAIMLIALLVVFDRFINFTSPLSMLGKRPEDYEKQELGTYQLNTGEEGSGEEAQSAGTEKQEEAAPAITNGVADTGKAGSTKEKKKDEESLDLSPASQGFRVTFEPPPLKLLNRDQGKPGVGDIKANANIIKRTLANFNVQVEMDEVSVGPTVTRYALKPAEGVKLSRIVGLKNDLALALAAQRIRIEAPIPGKSLVGIEIPNTTKSTIGLGTLLRSEEFQQSDKPLLTALGKGITGDSHFTNIAKMPHMLIAGATGSGKSVTIHSLVTSLLYRNSPDFLRFIMIDPKRVELTLYNSTPHLLTPVITDPKQAILALKWAQKEMSRRYDILESEQVRDIASYHDKIAKQDTKQQQTQNDQEASTQPETMPYIVIIIDELADIMQTYPRELESAIVRLAQMSRAVGIHLILSTQRPSVNVITGIIKANIPSRIALQVASQVDSRTILDAGGAESLLGAGDMLYVSGEMSKPTRIQSPFISEDEVKNVVNHLAKQYEEAAPDKIDFSDNEGAASDISVSDDDSDDEEDDELFEEARELVINSNKASTSFVQRKLKVGYARAARLMDMLEERGVVGPAEGSKPRQVLVNTSDDGFGTDESMGQNPQNASDESVDNQGHEGGVRY